MIGKELEIASDIFTVYKIQNKNIVLIEAKTGDIITRRIADIIRDIQFEVESKHLTIGIANPIIKQLRAILRAAKD